MLKRGLAVVLCAAAATAAEVQQVGWNVDSGYSPAQARAILVDNAPGVPPTGSWIRLRGAESWETLSENSVGAQRAEMADASNRPRSQGGGVNGPGRPVGPGHEQKLKLRNPEGPLNEGGFGAESDFSISASQRFNISAPIAARRADLKALRDRGFRHVAILRWPQASWPRGMRSTGPGQNRLPVDLSEAFERARALAATYGDLIDFWEIDNEPDISFVQENPETYAAFLKACYLGIAAGNRDAGKAENLKLGNAEEARQLSDRGSRLIGDATESVNGSQLSVNGSERLTANDRVRTTDHHLPTTNNGAQVINNHPPTANNQSRLTNNTSPVTTRETSRVLMAPLALPPGPYFEAFVRNDGLRYTDGFNYHFYGHAEDFSGMYWQFETAVRELGAENLKRWSGQVEKAVGARRAEMADALNRPRSQGGGVNGPGRPIGPGHGQTLKSRNADVEDGEEKAVKLKYRNTENSSESQESDFSISSQHFEILNRSATFHTQFYPSADGWRGEITAGFDHGAAIAQENADKLLKRPLASEEPPLNQVGRWLVTEGVAVEELPDGWRFRVDRLPPGKLRADAELPLPVGWSGAPESLISFEYRTVSQPNTKPSMIVPAEPALPADRATAIHYPQRTEVQDSSTSAGQPVPQIQNFSISAFAHGPAQPGTPVHSPLRLGSGADSMHRPSARVALRQHLPRRSLPIFLTEYGYGGLNKFARRTAEGRERQRAFFSSALDQIKVLGIEGAMAFYLPPYLEFDKYEFGLLMNEESAPPVTGAASRQRWGDYRMSPALEELLRRAGEQFEPKRWQIRTPNPSSIVIDFVAGKGFGMAKSYCGYFLEGEHGRTIPGEGELVVYNFGDEVAFGRLVLEGEAWRFAPEAQRLLDGSSRILGGDGRLSDEGSQLTGAVSMLLELKPGERRVVRVHVRSKLKRFVADPVSAWFWPIEQAAFEKLKAQAPKAETLKSGKAETLKPDQKGETPAAAPRRSAPMPSAGEPVHMFEAYFRTENGNLYQTWPRLIPNSNWQVYMQRMENFTPAFYGRLHQPWRFMDNKPAALVFFFRPETLPAVFEVRRPMMVRFSAPP